MNTIPQLFNVVYMLTNPLGERYIGSAVDLRRRMSEYKNGGGHADIGKSIAKYGWGNHTPTILAHGVSDAELRKTEYAFIDKHQPELNLRDFCGGRLRHAESSKKKMSAALKGRKLSPEHCAKISEAWSGENNPNFGKHLSPETRAKMSATKRGKPGKKHSPETRAKMSAALKGRKLSPEHCAKLSAVQRGKPKSPEARANMQAAQRGNKNRLGKKHSLETRAKLSAAAKAWRARARQNTNAQIAL